MFSFIKRSQNHLARARCPQPCFRLELELLEGRDVPSTTALPDIAVLSDRLDSPTIVYFDYRVAGAPGAFQVGLYRSAHSVFDADAIQIGSLKTITPPTKGTASGTFTLSSELPIDPAHKFVFVVADPNGLITEANEVNNGAYFRTLILGAVVHGLEFTDSPPPWEAQMATALQNDGYDQVIQFDWAVLSHRPVPGATIVAGNHLAAQVRLAATRLAVRPNDVIDLHLIGHSRGTSVVSQAFLNLQVIPGPKALKLGFHEETLLDPHPARNSRTLFWGLIELAANTGQSQIGGFSYDAGSVISRARAAAVLTFQALTRDPIPVVPPNVDQSEVFYEQLAWNQTTPGSVDYNLGINLQSQPPSAIANHSAKPIDFVNLAQFHVGHVGVSNWYLVNVVPTI